MCNLAILVLLLHVIGQNDEKSGFKVYFISYRENTTSENDSFWGGGPFYI